MSTLEVRDLVVEFGSARQPFRAVDSVSLSLSSSSVVGLVGESGSGKSTLAKAIVGLAPISAGEILWDGAPLGKNRRRIQFVFQDPYGSLDPRMSVGASLAEGVAANAAVPRSGRAAEVKRLLELVHLDPACARLRPRRLSGGQRQRVAIARALAAAPELLVADEITSALDVSVQGAVLNLLRTVQRETGIGILFISHNLAVVRYVADTIAVMHNGRLIEYGPGEQVIRDPRESYTKRLVEAVPSIEANVAAAGA